MPQSSSEQELSKHKQQAIDWLVLLRSDEISEQELCAFADWIAEDHLHSEAFAAAETLFDQMALAAKDSVEIKQEKEEHLDVSTFNNRQATKKNIKTAKLLYWFIPPAALAMMCLGAFFLVFPQQMQLFSYLGSDYRTNVGEMQNIKLSDGSRLLLNTNSAISVQFNDATRKIILHYGKARFSVAKDNIRPFVVETGNTEIHALGTVFQVYRPVSNNVHVVVQEHAVKVINMATNHEMYNHERPSAVTVYSGQQLTFQAGKALSHPEKANVRQQTAWQERRLIINDQPLGELIKELERYRNGRIFLYDNQLKDLHVTGVFSLEDPDEILKSVCKVLNLKETRIGGWWSVIHQ